MSTGGGRSAFLAARLRAQETAFTRDQDLHAYKSIRDALKGTGQLEAARERVEKVTPYWTIHAPSRAYCPTPRRVFCRHAASQNRIIVSEILLGMRSESCGSVWHLVRRCAGAIETHVEMHLCRHWLESRKALTSSLRSAILSLTFAKRCDLVTGLPWPCSNMAHLVASEANLSGFC